MLRDDIDEARALTKGASVELDLLRNTVAPLLTRLTGPIIDRQGQNHYIETLFHHYPRSTP